MAGVQVSGDIGEADKLIMMATIDGMVQGTGSEGSFTTQWCSRRVWSSYPETHVPTVMFYHKDLHAGWLTFKDINQWIDGAKHILLDIRFLKDKPCTLLGR